MADKIITTLDYMDNIQVDGNPFAEPANEYYALLCLRTGLDFLCRQAVKCDQIALSQLDPNKEYFSFGNSPLLTGIPNKLLTCVCHWYSISACQYVRTIGAIAYRQDNSRMEPVEYVKIVIPEIKIFRDKVAAHFAWLTKNKHDNEAERLASIIPQVAFSDDYFQVGTLSLSMRRSGKSSSSREIKPWSITKIHKRLQARYWPEEIESESSTP